MRDSFVFKAWAKSAISSIPPDPDLFKIQQFISGTGPWRLGYSIYSGNAV